MQTLKEIRLMEAMRLGELAEKSGISKGYLSYVERGIKKATPWTLKKIARALGKDFNLILWLHEEQVKNAKTSNQERSS